MSTQKRIRAVCRESACALVIELRSCCSSHGSVHSSTRRTCSTLVRVFLAQCRWVSKNAWWSKFPEPHLYAVPHIVILARNTADIIIDISIITATTVITKPLFQHRKWNYAESLSQGAHVLPLFLLCDTISQCNQQTIHKKHTGQYMMFVTDYEPIRK